MVEQRQLDLPILVPLLLLFIPFSLIACGTLEIILDSAPTSGEAVIPTAVVLATKDVLVTPLTATPAPLPTLGQSVYATVSALATDNAYLATKVAAQPVHDIEATVAVLATMNAYLATQVAAPITPASDPTGTPEPDGTPTPYCRPSESSVSLYASATTLEVGQFVSVTVTLVNGDATDVGLGNVQYLLRVQPSDILTSNNLGPVVHPLSLEPGQSDEVEFVLQAAMPGRAMLTGLTDFEIHAMDYSWGSWSGCQSWPLEIVVTPYLVQAVINQRRQEVHNE